MSEPHESDPTTEPATEPAVGPAAEAVTDDGDGGMGGSSATRGHTGPGQFGTHGTRDVGPEHRDPDAEVPPEQSAGGVEVNPDPPIAPKAGYNSHDPRAAEHPYGKPPRT